jgi:hypothetical protein
MKIAYNNEWNNQAIGAGFDGYAPAVNYFEAPPFAGAVGSPVTSDPNWSAISSSPNHQVSYYGEYMIAENRGTGGGNFVVSTSKGDVTRCEQHIYTDNYTNVTDQYFGIIGDGTFANRVGFFVAGGGGSDPIGTIRMTPVVDGVFTPSGVLGSIGSNMRGGIIEINIIGADVAYSLTLQDTAFNSYVFTGTLVGAYNSAVQYGIYQVSNFCNTRVDFARIEGAGFPYNE